MKLRLCLPILLLLSSWLSAQNPSRVTIKGIVKDTLGEVIPLPTVMLLNPKDSTLVNFTRGDENGAFSFKNVKNSPYLLKVSYVGFLPLQQYLPVSATETNDLATVTIKPITSELLEVVIKAARSTLSIRGDTIEYDASSFKVPPGSTIEDMLRRLPGIEVDADGNIKAQGKDVKKVYVDGKTFFGDDPKAATKNLGAETLSKIQVYNEKSEQAKLTGVDDGKKEKAMNLELKEEYKKGAFGKVTGAVGTEERWAGRGNFNRFNSKEQFSVIGYANNINQTGVNWEDYGEFKGQNTFNDNDNGDFGFSTGGGRYYMMGGDDSDIPFNNFDGRGFTKNFGGGANYNFDNKKTKFSSSYFYNETTLDLNQYSSRQTFLRDSSFFNTDTTTNIDFRGNHSIAARLESDLDSNNLLIVKANTRFSNSNAMSQQSQLFTISNDVPTSSLNLDNSNDLQSWRLSGTAIFRHRFKKKGRSVALSTGYNNSLSDGTDNLFSINRFFEAETFTEQIRQLNTKDNHTQQFKSSLLFTEALSKKWFWENFYNFSKTQNEVNRQVTDPVQNNRRIDALSVFYDNDVLYNRIGSSIRYSNKGLNVSTGVAAQQIKLSGAYSIDRNSPLLADPINKTFTNFVPNIQSSYEFPNNVWLSLGYGYNVNEPRLSDLQPVPNVSNPAFRSEGNPDLEPERNHNIDLNLNYWNPASLSNVGIGAEYNRYDNQIVYSQNIEVLDSVGIRTTTRPENVAGGQRGNMYLWSNFPIVKTKLTMNVGGDFNIGETPAFVNGIENTTFNQGLGIRTGFNFTPSPKFIAGLNANIRLNDISYSIQKEQNQKIRNQTLGASIKWQFASKFFFESNFDYSRFRNARFGFSQDVPIWNASVRRLVGKQNRIELRLAAFDLLNQRVNITQSGSQNYVITNVASTLSRYFMLNVSYNFRGYENKIKKNDWW